MNSQPVACRYHWIQDLKAGASGSVTLCYDSLKGENVAVKHIPRGHGTINKHVLAELTNHRTLLHHHVIQFKEVFLTEKHLCIVMEYANGGNMADYVKHENGLKESEARWYFQQLMIGIEYCHKMGIANRDIKLENTLLQKINDITLLKICDFGYSKHESYHSTPKSTVGSPQYLPPEVINKQKKNEYDGKIADIWCCGVFLYAMVYGVCPFEVPADRSPNRTIVDVTRLLERILNNPVKTPDYPQMSSQFHDLLSKILVKNPEQRITLEGIMRHPWFEKHLPHGAIGMNHRLQKQEDGIQSMPVIRQIFKEARIARQASDGKLIDAQLKQASDRMDTT